MLTDGLSLANAKHEGNLRPGFTLCDELKNFRLAIALSPIASSCVCVDTQPSRPSNASTDSVLPGIGEDLGPYGEAVFCCNTCQYSAFGDFPIRLSDGWGNRNLADHK